MTPFWSDDHLTLYGGDCREVLRELPAESVHCVVTSPPYWGLRDYGIGNKGLGLEATPEAFVANMVDVFREVRRVLRKDGTLWLNLGDSYASSGVAGPMGKPNLGGGGDFFREHGINEKAAEYAYGRAPTPPGLKPKDLVGIPWRVAFALQADGWYLRSDIIWAKPNPMPESVTDRPTKAHEYLFLLARSPRYYYDAEAVREAAEYGTNRATFRGGGAYTAGQSYDNHADVIGDGEIRPRPETTGRNLRSVWNIATEPYPGAHFATFPRKLVEPCVKAGTSERGVCPECGAPWVRVVERGDLVGVDRGGNYAGRDIDAMVKKNYGTPGLAYENTTTGWRPSCTHEAEPVPAVVLDPFAGSGTTLLVAQSLGRRGIGIDLSPDYLKQALERNRQTPLGLVG